MSECAEMPTSYQTDTDSHRLRISGSKSALPVLNLPVPDYDPGIQDLDDRTLEGLYAFSKHSTTHVVR